MNGLGKLLPPEADCARRGADSSTRCARSEGRTRRNTRSREPTHTLGFNGRPAQRARSPGPHIEDPPSPAECDALVGDLGAAATAGGVAVAAGVGANRTSVLDDERVAAVGADEDARRAARSDHGVALA